MSNPTRAHSESSPTPTFTPAPAALLHRKCACGGTPGPTGECAECHKERLTGAAHPSVQTSLTVGQPGDRYEQEADRVADAVMRMPDPSVQRQDQVADEEERIHSKPLAGQITPLVQRQGQPEEEKEEEESVQAKPTNGTLVQRRTEFEDEERDEAIVDAKATPGQTPELASGFEARLDAVRRGGGQPLDPRTRTFMEPRFGYDFSRVIIHADSQGAQLTRALKSQAFTSRHDIVFDTGRYAPKTPAGKHLLAHELTHVVQQQPAIRLKTKTSRHSRAPHGAKKTAAPMRVVGHGASPKAVSLARKNMIEILSSLRAPNASQLTGLSLFLHVIPHDKDLTDLAIFSDLSGKETHDKERDYDDLRGVGPRKIGDTVHYAIAEEQLILIRKKKKTKYALGFVATHESGHVVRQLGLTEKQEQTLLEIYEARKLSKAVWLEPFKYTSSNAGEYFAQSTAAYFEQPYAVKHKKSYTKRWLKANDPKMFALLQTVFKSHKVLKSGPKTPPGAQRGGKPARRILARGDHLNGWRFVFVLAEPTYDEGMNELSVSDRVVLEKKGIPGRVELQPGKYAWASLQAWMESAKDAKEGQVRRPTGSSGVRG